MAGGPWNKALGVPTPVALQWIGVRHGVHDRIDIDGDVNVAALAFGVAAVDLGTVVQLWRRDPGLAVSVSGRAHLWGDLNDAPSMRVFPEVGLHLGGPVMDHWTLYGGWTTTGTFHRGRQALPWAFHMPFAGSEWHWHSRRRDRFHGIATHVTWIQPWDGSQTAARWAPRYGAVATFFAYRLHFPGGRR